MRIMTDSKDVKLTIRGGLSNEEVRRNIAILPWRIIYHSFQQNIRAFQPQ